MVSSHTGIATLDAASPVSPRPYPADRPVQALFAAQAQRTPDAQAVVADDASLTYAELDQRANHLANFLRAQGIGPEVCVALCLDRSAAYIVGALGILKAGGAYLPLDPATPADRLAFQLRDAAAPVLLTAQRLAAHLPTGPWRTVLLDAGWPEVAAYPAHAPEVGTASDDLAYVIYTSGSTGQPKGVEITHRALLNLVHWHQDEFAVSAADRATQIASVAFDAAVWEVWPYLTRGAAIHVPGDEAKAEPARLRDWLIARGITITFVPTPLAELLLALPWPLRTQLRYLLTGGDMLHIYPSADLPFALVNNYGPTENTVVATSGLVAPESHPEHPPTIGRPIANVVAYLLDEQLQPVPDGTPGELCIGGPSLARGYRNRPDLTAARFIPDPFSADPAARLYRTGDLVKRLPSGDIAFLGRADEQVKIRGYRIELAEIATVLNNHPDVQASIVVAREDTPGEKRLVAYLIPADGALLTVSALRDFLVRQLPDYMVPAAFVALAGLPFTTNGKVDRNALPVPDAGNTLGDDTFIAPRSTLEEGIAGILCGLLNLDRISVVENFFMLGGHSLLGLQVIARIRDTFAVELPLRSLFDAPTVAGLAAEVETLILARLDTLTEEEIAQLLG
jgi:amino acid adenylation domain-containing protein